MRESSIQGIRFIMTMWFLYHDGLCQGVCQETEGLCGGDVPQLQGRAVRHDGGEAGEQEEH